MTPDKRYWYATYKGYETRSQRRLQTDLGLDEAAAETILRLRNDIIELQTKLHRLEVEMEAQSANQDLRLARYHNFYYEANWIELEFQA